MSEIQTNGWAQSSREKASKKVQQLINTFPADIAPEDKFQRLVKQFAVVASCTHKCAENFDPGAFEERNLGVNTSKFLSSLRDAHELGVCQLEALQKEMEKMPLAHVNGTSVEFANCTQTLMSETIRFEKSRTDFEKNIVKCASETMQAAQHKLASLMAQISVAILFMGEMQVI
ncbi:MAG: hypothetical protein DI626_09020 [Micavibrio aeruginosavorus]|uniref:Uncharacterized protein n=1 Tax=Micavibrio aeruginosavorus TaxID=349221 RepID=A0A2W5BKA9_9BACT|nr:MAG: hypothetical protein DI626_09020 [Micavibrio aeruginosavorus]